MFHLLSSRGVFIVVTTFAAAVAAAQPLVNAALSDRLALLPGATNVSGSPTQMTWGPDGRLFVMTTDGGVRRYSFNRTTGALTGGQRVAEGIFGIGIAFHRRTMYLSAFDGSIWRLLDNNQNGIYGETGEIRVPIVYGIPVGDHTINQMEIHGDTLYCGIGTRTINGRPGPGSGGSIDDNGGTGFWSGGEGNTWGESIYGGSISWIRNLYAARSEPGSANSYTTQTIDQNLIQFNMEPLMLQENGEPVGNLTLHSCGTRNPYGIGLDAEGSLYFTNNFGRANSLGDGTNYTDSPLDVLDDDFTNDVYDQFFRAGKYMDYGYGRENLWRTYNAILNPVWWLHERRESLTYDNLTWMGGPRLHVPGSPLGLGPHAAAAGFDFWYWAGLRSLAGNAFVTRWNHTVTERFLRGTVTRSLTYADVVAISPANGRVVRVMSGFQNPIDTIAEGRWLIVADHTAQKLYVARGS